MNNEIRNILEVLNTLEGKLTPVAVKHGLNPQQTSVDQLPADFEPKNIKALGSKTDPQHPAKNYFVGEESKEMPVDEDVLGKIKRGLNDYLKTIEKEIKGDSDLKNKKPDTRELQAKSKDKDLLPKITGTLSNKPRSSPIKTFTLEDGRMCEIHGDENQGFCIKHQGRELPSKFDSLNDAEIAMQMYQVRRKQRIPQVDVNPDYVDEA